jgi:hypothetical protein
LLVGARSALAEEAKFSFTGTEQEFEVPAGVTSVHVVAVGGAGGTGASKGLVGNHNEGGPGGLGAVVSDNLGVTAGQTLYVEVGGNGESERIGASGGFNGGGTVLAGGGGGASDVRTASVGAGPSPGNEASLKSRLLVAAGGGGGGLAECFTEVGRGGAGGNAEEAGHDASGCAAAETGGGGGAGTSEKGGAGGSAVAPHEPGHEGARGQGGGAFFGGGGGGGLYGGGAGGDGLAGGGGGGGSNLGAVVGTVKTGEEGSVTITYTALPTSKEQCRKGGWKNFGTTFKNQGQCAKFVEAEQHAARLGHRHHH